MGDKILVVDDEQQVRDLLNTFLKREGYEVVVASNGEEAIELAEAENPQLILLDVVMPGLDGIETCRKLKSQETTKSIPVIISTAFRDTLGEALEAGADDFLTKPFHLLEVAIRVKSILRVQHLSDELDRAVAYTMELQKNLPKK
jgi:DNA-binding response OmpR family regulator